MISSIRLSNFQCFRGEHTLLLDAKAYAIFARLEKDSERSNMLGKTSLLEAIHFALYGEHRHRLDDDWISRGEKIGEVEVEIPAGRILRRRERGKATRLYYFPRGSGDAVVMKDEAQHSIEAAVGLDKRDFAATCYFRQKSISRFVTSRPEERMKMVSAWLRLEKLEACEKRAKAMSSTLELDAAKLSGMLATCDQREAMILAGGASVERMSARIAELEARVEQRRGELALLDQEIDREVQRARARGAKARFDEIVLEGKKASDDLRAMNVEARKQRAAEASSENAAAMIALSNCARRLSEMETVSRGEFDGKCPLAGIECPARAEINSRGEDARRAYQGARRAYELAEDRQKEAGSKSSTANSALQESERAQARLDALRDQAKKMLPFAREEASASNRSDAATVLEETRSRIEKLRQEQMTDGAEISRIRQQLSDLEQIANIRASCEEQGRAFAARLGLLREAVAVFGKRGAQRRVAESALSEIEAGANEVLRACGVNLSVAISWSREGQEPASACDRCGHPFPSSTKIKECQRCGNARGQRLENKLEISLSDRSGAAEDLAGIATQLAASRWLCADRGSTWGTAMLDEPFGALDAAHRRGLSRHLATMLSTYGFAQSLVVSHSPDTAHALPGRIEIVSDGHWSSVRVA